MPQQDRFVWMTPLDSCKNNGWDGETEPIFSCSSKASNSSIQNCAARWNTKKRKGLSKQAALQAPASMEVAVRTVFISVAKTSVHSCLHCPSAVLQREGFWQHKGLGKAQYDFGGKFHPHLQRIGNTEKARLLEVDVDQWGCYGQFHFLFNRLTAQKNPTRQWGETFNEHDPAFFTTNSSIEDVV